MSAHAEVPMGVMPHGGMFTFINVIPKNPKIPWKHPSQKTPEKTNVDAFGYPNKLIKNNERKPNNTKLGIHEHA